MSMKHLSRPVLATSLVLVSLWSPVRAAPALPHIEAQAATALNSVPLAFDTVSFNSPSALANARTQGNATTATALASAGLGSVGPSCGQSGAAACASVNAATGAMKGYAFSELAGQTGATVLQYDNVGLGSSSLVFTLHVDLGALQATGEGSEARFFAGLSGYDGSAYQLSIMGYGARKTIVGGVPQFQVFSYTPAGVVNYASPPSVLDLSFPVPIPAGGLNIEWSLSAGVTAGLGGSASVDVSNTAYLGIVGPYVSQGGYSYLGAAPVPEPGALAMALGGMLGVLLRLHGHGLRRRP